MDELLTVAEFAERAGVSKQAVYKRMAKDLKIYSKTIQGVKYVSSVALDLFDGETETEKKPAPAPKDKQTSPAPTESGAMAYLISQLEEKDRLIAELTAENKELHKHIMTQSEKQTQLQENFQILLGQQARLLQGLSPVSTVEQPVEQPVETVAVEPVEPAEEPAKEKPKGFFRRFFGL